MCCKISAEVESVRYGLDAICTLISDDGVYSTAEELYKLSLKYGIKFTVAQVIRNISDLQRLQELERGNYLEFISHSYSHLNMESEEISEQVLYHEIVESMQYMEQYFVTPQIAFIPPNNQLSKKAYHICKKHFYAIRRWKRELNPLSPAFGVEPFNWLNLGCKGIGDVKTTQERNRWVDQCIKQKKWLIEMWHDVDKDISEGYQTINPEEAEEHVAYICSKRDEGILWVASFVDATKYILEKQTSSLHIYERDKNVWEIYLSSSISEKDARFDMPLSIRVRVSDNLPNITIKRDNKSIKRELKNEEGILSTIIEMRPEEHIIISVN